VLVNVSRVQLLAKDIDLRFILEVHASACNRSA
jgi:hypothetical protein